MNPIKRKCSFRESQNNNTMTFKGVVRIVIYTYICSICAAENIHEHQNMSIKALPDITSLCPYNQFCKSSPSKVSLVVPFMFS